jgi:hypothetical protein
LPPEEIEMPKQWDEQYLRECVDDEIALAAVHPKHRRRVSMPSLITLDTELFPDPPRGNFLMSGGASRQTLSTPLPRWRRDWNAAGPLIGELGLEIRHDPDEGTVSVNVVGGGRRGTTEEYRDHPSRDAAVMAALVRAATKAFIEARDNN